MRTVRFGGAKKCRLNGIGVVLALFSAIDDPSGAVVTLDPVAAAHVFNTHFTTRARCMQEAAFAEVDANVREGAPHRVEEDEVARFQFLAVNARPDFAHFLRGARQHQPDRILEYQLHEATAVQAGIRVRTARR